VERGSSLTVSGCEIFCVPYCSTTAYAPGTIVGPLTVLGKSSVVSIVTPGMSVTGG